MGSSKANKAQPSTALAWRLALSLDKGSPEVAAKMIREGRTDGVHLLYIVHQKVGFVNYVIIC